MDNNRAGGVGVETGKGGIEGRSVGEELGGKGIKLYLNNNKKIIK